MAVVDITPVSIPLNGNAEMPATTAITSTTDGAIIPFAEQDTKILVLIENANASAAKDATFVKGNGLQGVANLVVSIPATETHGFVVDSGRFKNVSGTYKGKVQVLGASTDIKVAAVILP